MAGILILFTFILSQLLDQILNMNLDKFLHQQSDNFQSTITLNEGKISFHDLNSNFDHRGSRKDEIPFYLQMVDIQGHTIMLTGNLEGRRLYHGKPLAHDEILETVFFFDKPSRRLTTPVFIKGRHLGWLLVTIPFDYLEPFKIYKNKILSVATIIGVILFIFLAYVFIRLALKPVKHLAQSAEALAKQSKIDMLPAIHGEDEFSYLTTTLNNLLQKAGQSMETMELFAANVSHELKTPLALMHSEIALLKNRIGYEYQESFDMLDQEVDRMQTLIDNILVISHSQQPYELSLSDIWINDFISDEVGRLQRIFRLKQIHFDFLRVKSLKIKTDIYLLQLVVDNIIRNALLYSPEKSTVTLSSVEEADHISIHICDEGPGISNIDMTKIMEPFVRGNTNTFQVMKGSGLGLSISRWAIDLLGGTMDLNNRDPQGLCATFTIPIR
jgi:signal transduction histidine kinase